MWHERPHEALTIVRTSRRAELRRRLIGARAWLAGAIVAIAGAAAVAIAAAPHAC